MARFWAAALHYEKEDHSELVKGLLESGALSPQDTVEVDGGRQFAVVSACRDTEAKGPRLYFQKVPEGKVVKNRAHLDLQAGPDHYEAEAARLEGLGARETVVPQRPRCGYLDDGRHRRQRVLCALKPGARPRVRQATPE